MPTITQLKNNYKNDPVYRAQVDDTVKKSKTNYGVQLTKDDVFRAVASGSFLGEYAKRKKASAKKK